MSSNLVIKFDSVIAIIHVICIAFQIGILLYQNHNGKVQQQPYNNNQGGYR